MNIFAHMTVIRLTKEFSFEAAHALDGYDGPCREIHEEIVSHFDHSLVLRQTPCNASLRAMLAERFGNIVTVDYQPTCENMLGDFARRISRRLPEGVELHSLRLHETATSFAEWFAEDNR